MRIENDLELKAMNKLRYLTGNPTMEQKRYSIGYMKAIKGDIDKHHKELRELYIELDEEISFLRGNK